ncbi:MAG: protoporphyrinogen oxidase [Acidimicrobiaceae bacterium]|nr:protoporphyrinogen oxidase [Acidimicrobiaceae bacterium]MYE95958.1 protoporphyrinogen oxidase [Acidimicrobiaceae bacterium]MYH43239.1 protoporphyrinogen oxidase [Acidimicrobiaceae bacterium]MYI54919.1 protoporphyrinogen oxidase [Acidimicrobiaceae bacterium]MYJ80546.1 protoporphyrinogen oxidase [Acidimicrobiaceae bacterium]
MPVTAPGSRVVIVGAGISGLAAAYELQGAGIEAVVLEAGDRPGGKIDSAPVGGLTVDSGPDGFVARDPAAAELCRRLGLGTELVEPAASRAYVWVDGRLCPLPARSVLGVVWTADAVAGAGVVTEQAVEVLARGLARDVDPLLRDASVGEVLRPRVGDEVFERLVDPLLGGINAGSADGMSIEACAPPLYEAAQQGGPLGPALREVAARQGRDPDPEEPATVFQSVSGGVTRIVDALAAELGEAVKLATPVESVQPRAARGAGRRWRVATPNGPLDADGVILTCPAWESARLLEPLVPGPAGILGEIEYSDVALAVFVLPRDRLARPLDGSGFLVPRDQGLLTTACSWASAKWPHYDREDLAVLRVSAGRTDDRRWLDLSEEELVAALASELAGTGMVSAEDATQGRFEVRVTPWPRSLPQYRPGHLERAAAVDAGLADGAPGLVTAGAAFQGVGLPACIRGAQEAASALRRAVLC